MLMPPIATETSMLIADLQARLARVVEVATQEGRDTALAQVRSIVGGGGVAVGPIRRGPGRPMGSKNKPKDAATAKPKQKRKNSWAGLSASERLARVNAIRKGKGLPPRSA
jgi:hypothetical protein